MRQEIEEYTISQIRTGVEAKNGTCTCLVCGTTFADGEVYRFGERFFTAAKAADMHVKTEHGDRLDALLFNENKYLQVTEHQKKLLRLLAQGLSDEEIAQQTGASPATVRRQRFSFREKAKRAKMFLAVYALTEEKHAAAANTPLPLQEGANPMLQQHQITKQENDKYLRSAFYTLAPLRLRTIPAKDKRRFAVINRIAQLFEANRDYTEKEVNAILEQVHPQDYVVLRRYLIEYGFLGREKDGSRYWLL